MVLFNPLALCTVFETVLQDFRDPRLTISMAEHRDIIARKICSVNSMSLGQSF
jgi:hypothetical protein